MHCIYCRQEAMARFGPEFFSQSNNFGTPLPVEGGKRFDWLPTFWEFVQFILDTE